MIVAPPAIVVVPLASKEQVYQTISYVASKVRQTGAPVKHVHSDGPLYLESRSLRDVVERVDVYIASAGGDFANVIPAQEEIREGFIEKRGYVHIVQGVAVLFRYRVGGEPRLEEVVIYTVGAPYRDFKFNL